MISGVALDIFFGIEGHTWARILGVALILAGMVLTQTQKK